MFTTHRCTTTAQAVSQPQSAQCCRDRGISITLLTGQRNGECCSVQIEKSEHLAISSRKSDNTSPRVTMNGTQIPEVTSHKHLGVNFNNTLSWHQHVDKVYTSCAPKNRSDPAITTKDAPGCSEANILGSSTAKIGIRMPSVVWWTNTEANCCRRNGTALPSLQTRFDYHTLVRFYKVHTKQAHHMLLPSPLSLQDQDTALENFLTVSPLSQKPRLSTVSYLE